MLSAPSVERVVPKPNGVSYDPDVSGGKPRRLGEILVAAGIVDSATVEQLLREQKSKSGGRLGSLLIQKGVCTHEQIRDALRKQMNVEVVDLEAIEPDPLLADLLPIELIRRYEVIPLRKEDQRLWVAMLDPYNLAAIDDIRFRTGFTEVSVAACVESDFKNYIRDHLETSCLIDEILEEDTFYQKAIQHVRTGDAEVPTVEIEKQEEEATVHDLRLAINQSPIVTLCDFILVEAIKQRASDIHIEPYESFFRVRLRVDGRLRTLITPPKRLEVPIVTRFKVVAEMDIAKRRIPQDGQLSVRYNRNKVHFRVSTIPTSFGEKCVLRVLKKDPTLNRLDELGFEPENLQLFKRVLKEPQGLILITGPTGSGKTTTVHAGLDYINDGELNIVTLEDPVEATIPGVNHVPIHPLGGVTFASGLRSILRQDPDVVFVGEMRDPEVCSIAIRSSLTGHLVISTLHTNSAVESLVRLDDMDIAPYLIAGSLRLIIAQRLMRKVCSNCTAPHTPTSDEVETLGLPLDKLKHARFRKGTGCRACGDSGYLGRIAAYEMLRVDSRLRELIRRRAPSEEIFRAARKSGMRTMMEAALQKALRGETTLSEMGRVIYTVD